MRGRNVCSWKITLGTLTRFYAPSREPGSSKDDARYDVGCVNREHGDPIFGEKKKMQEEMGNNSECRDGSLYPVLFLAIAKLVGRCLSCEEDVRR